MSRQEQHALVKTALRVGTNDAILDALERVTINYYKLILRGALNELT